MINSFMLNIRSMFNHFVRMNTIADNVANIGVDNYQTKRADFNENPLEVIEGGTGLAPAGGGNTVTVSTDTSSEYLAEKQKDQDVDTAYKSTNNTNLVSEFNGMIVTHAGFTASSQVIETADAMMAETLSIKQTEHSEVKGGADPFTQRENAYRGMSRLGS